MENFNVLHLFGYDLNFCTTSASLVIFASFRRFRIFFNSKKFRIFSKLFRVFFHIFLIVLHHLNPTFLFFCIKNSYFQILHHFIQNSYFLNICIFSIPLSTRIYNITQTDHSTSIFEISLSKNCKQSSTQRSIFR